MLKNSNIKYGEASLSSFQSLKTHSKGSPIKLLLEAEIVQQPYDVLLCHVFLYEFQTAISKAGDAGVTSLYLYSAELLYILSGH